MFFTYCLKTCGNFYPYKLISSPDISNLLPYVGGYISHGLLSYGGAFYAPSILPIIPRTPLTALLIPRVLFAFMSSLEALAFIY
jgi:hypothetical protein